jgi:hypothetical protein
VEQTVPGPIRFSLRPDADPRDDPALKVKNSFFRERGTVDELASRLGVEALRPEQVAALLEREAVSSIDEIPADAELLVGQWDEVLESFEQGRRGAGRQG